MLTIRDSLPFVVVIHLVEDVGAPIDVVLDLGDDMRATALTF
jgi:hypothetical protein